MNARAIPPPERGNQRQGAEIRVIKSSQRETEQFRCCPAEDGHSVGIAQTGRFQNEVDRRVGPGIGVVG